MIKLKKKVLLLTRLLTFTVLTGCSMFTGEEVARLRINEISRKDQKQPIKETSIELKKDEEIAIWSDMDIEYERHVSLRFKLEIFKDGESFKELEIDPANKSKTIGEVKKTTALGKTSLTFKGKNAEMKVFQDGIYTFKGELVADSDSLPEIKIKKAELFFKK